MERDEETHYNGIVQRFTELFEAKGFEVYFEKTANREFSNRLKKRIPWDRHIVFYFLRKIRPDITGLATRKTTETSVLLKRAALLEDKDSDIIIIEVKDKEIELGDIYQMRMYAELLDAKFAFLVSTEEIPEAIERLAKAVHPLLSAPSIYHCRTLVYFDEEDKSFKDWYPENPFEKEIFWMT